eukprot:TRINITY_DN27743_c0_g1_i1.p1 TRINITY_DN27743_c0_g1~~TRINITY_DN27743_c0_g1_i1.p1  ORF type:complete len:428 (-),score=96.13 TRINITY_DN27743_c0_g1_i1:53-1336(-)
MVTFVTCMLHQEGEEEGEEGTAAEEECDEQGISAQLEEWLGLVDQEEMSLHEKLCRFPHDALDGGLEGSALLSMVCAMNHSCSPNVMVTWDSLHASAAATATVFALRPIAEGDELFISYLDPKIPFHERQAELQAYLFECRCTKCLFQSEAGQFAPQGSERAHALREYAKSANDEDRDEDAVEALEQLVGLKDGTVDDTILLATCLMNQGCWKQGYDLIHRAQERFGPDNPKLMERLAVCKFSCCSAEQAAEWDGEVTRMAVPSGHHLALSESNVVPAEQCQWVVDQAEAAAAAQGGWGTARHYSVPTTDLSLHMLPEVLVWFNGLIRSWLFPMVCAQYELAHPEALRVHDGFIVKYSATNGQRSLPVHVDQSTFSLTIALNPVSYTHLRAHETPEHLVCRLLLEKKKKVRRRKNNERERKIKTERK